MAYKSFTRQELHTLVWSRPMRDLASEIGTSDVRLKKICVKFDIATPPQGHWQKVANGRPSALAEDNQTWPEVLRPWPGRRWPGTERAVLSGKATIHPSSECRARWTR
jgi:hypothetical protein